MNTDKKSVYAPVIQNVIISLVVGLLVVWLLLAITFWRGRPENLTAREFVRLLPDTLRLLQRLARDRSLDRRVRWWLWVLLAYLASPIDVIPDFIPVIGYADDAIVVFIALRSVIRRAGLPAVERHWPGTPEGMTALLGLIGVADD